MHLFVTLNLVPFALVILPCLILNFPPTKEVPFLTDCLMLSLPGICLYCICCCFKYLSCRRADRTAQTVEYIRSITFVNSKTVVWGWERRFWHFRITFSISSSVSAKDMVWVSISRSKNSISCDGFRTDFFRFMTRPDAEVEKSMCFSSLNLVLFFPSEEYRRDISLDKCSAASVELLERKGTERSGRVYIRVLI